MGGQKSKVKVLVGLAPCEVLRKSLSHTSLLTLLTAGILVLLAHRHITHLLMAFICVPISFSWGHHHWIKAHPTPAWSHLSHICKCPFSKHSRFHEYQGLGLKHSFNTVQPIPSPKKYLLHRLPAAPVGRDNASHMTMVARPDMC